MKKLLVLLLICLISYGCTLKNNSIDVQEEVNYIETQTIVLEPVEGDVFVSLDGVGYIDYSNISQGYIIANYKGDNHKVKLQIKTPTGINYNYNLHGGPEVFPLTEGNGEYSASICENVKDSQYAIALSCNFCVELENEFIPFLYPNQNVNFNKDSNVVKIGEELAQKVTSKLDIVANVYNYVMKNLEYDYKKADTVQSGYIPDVDEILDLKKGICFDYASVMASMLRSQGIPTMLDIGYAGDVYHAWISVYTDETGWINGIIEFDGKQWKLMDPTFADSNRESKDIMKFINDTSNYIRKYKY